MAGRATRGIEVGAHIGEVGHARRLEVSEKRRVVDVPLHVEVTVAHLHARPVDHPRDVHLLASSSRSPHGRVVASAATTTEMAKPSMPPSSIGTPTETTRGSPAPRRSYSPH